MFWLKSFTILLLSVFPLWAQAQSDEAIITPVNACPTPHNDCVPGCGTSCTYWSCEDHTVLPVTITQLPTSFIRAKPQCTERLQSIELLQIPLPGSQKTYVVNDVQKLPLDFMANSYACVPHQKMGSPCPWTVGNWGSCSVACGPGTQTRSVTCDGAYCDPSVKPAEVQSCNPKTCEWITGSWGSCSAECGGGIQTRTVSCEGAAGSCDETLQPTTSQSCNTQACNLDCRLKTRYYVFQECVGETSADVLYDGAYYCGYFGEHEITIPNGASKRFFPKDFIAMKFCSMLNTLIFPETSGVFSQFLEKRTCNNGILSGSAKSTSIYENTKILCWEPPGSPLMVHMNASATNVEPLVFTNPVDGINFDLLGANAQPAPYSPVRISWYRSSQYYFIVLPDIDGKVKGIDQLFGDNTLGPDKKFAADGYVALSKYDGKTADGSQIVGAPDGYITYEDPVMAKLRFWNDINSDGIAQTSEMKSAMDLGIELIDLQADASFIETDRYGNQTTLKSVVQTKDGEYHVMFDVWFRFYSLEKFEKMKSNPQSFIQYKDR